MRRARTWGGWFAACAAALAVAGEVTPPTPEETARLIAKIRQLEPAQAAGKAKEREILAEARRQVQALRAKLYADAEPLAAESDRMMASLQAADARLAKDRGPDDPERKKLRQQIADLGKARETALTPFLQFARTMKLDLGNEVSIDFVLIPAGTFLMGSPESEKQRSRFEGPQHRVTFTKPLYMSACEITQEQYRAVMESNPSYYRGPKRPVANLSAEDAMKFCQKLSARTGLTVRLPTEAEWEYACRAGTTTRYSSGDDDASLNACACTRANTPSGEPQPVGTKKPNAWGLFDMHGNAEEWCSDWYDSTYYETSPLEDPPGPATGSYRIYRGGSAYSSAADCRSACRAHSVDVDARRGFRVVCNAR